jgi:hypothetical protein
MTTPYKIGANKRDRILLLGLNEAVAGSFNIASSDLLFTAQNTAETEQQVTLQSGTSSRFALQGSALRRLPNDQTPQLSYCLATDAVKCFHDASICGLFEHLPETVFLTHEALYWLLANEISMTATVISSSKNGKPKRDTASYVGLSAIKNFILLLQELGMKVFVIDEGPTKTTVQTKVSKEIAAGPGMPKKVITETVRQHPPLDETATRIAEIMQFAKDEKIYCTPSALQQLITKPMNSPQASTAAPIASTSRDLSQPSQKISAVTDIQFAFAFRQPQAALSIDKNPVIADLLPHHQGMYKSFMQKVTLLTSQLENLKTSLYDNKNQALSVQLQEQVAKAILEINAATASINNHDFVRTIQTATAQVCITFAALKSNIEKTKKDSKKEFIGKFMLAILASLTGIGAYLYWAKSKEKNVSYIQAPFAGWTTGGKRRAALGAAEKITAELKELEKSSSQSF